MKILIYGAGVIGSIYASRLYESGCDVTLLARGEHYENLKQNGVIIREGFTACKTLGMPISPTNLKIIFMIMPEWFSILYWQKAMQGKVGTLAMAPHANKAKDEMRLLAKIVLTTVHSSSFATPTLDILLYAFINSNDL